MALAVHEPAAGEKLEQVVARFQDLALENAATADEVTHALFGLRGNPHGRELTETRALNASVRDEQLEALALYSIAQVNLAHALGKMEYFSEPDSSHEKK